MYSYVHGKEANKASDQRIQQIGIMRTCCPSWFMQNSPGCTRSSKNGGFCQWSLFVCSRYHARVGSLPSCHTSSVFVRERVITQPSFGCAPPRIRYTGASSFELTRRVLQRAFEHTRHNDTYCLSIETENRSLENTRTHTE